MIPRVLISDSLSDMAVDVFRERGIEVDFQPKLGPQKERLAEIIGQYDGLAIRSATKVTPKVIAAANGRLRVIGRAGIGIDNVDLAAATAAGIIVMNTPFGNSITTAEHTIAMLLACARSIPAADQSTQAGRWEKSRFVGMELAGKTLGIIGCGNVGTIVADRALGLQMKVIAYDPYLTQERAAELGVEKVELEDLLRRADAVTLHTPLTDRTRDIIDAAAIARMKDGVRIVNCARGGLVVEKDLRAALQSGKVAGAAVDVFAEEPATDNVLFGAPNIICTPHLGASTVEAQEKVAMQIAEQMADYLTTGAVRNALNMPSITAEEAPRLTPFIRLAEQLGSFAGQLTESAAREVLLEYEGAVADMNTRALTAAALSGFLQPVLQAVNMVSAAAYAKDRGLQVQETRREQRGAYESYVRLTVVTDRQSRSVAGTVFSDGRPRIIQIKGIDMEAELGPHMLYVTNRDKPGFIGRLGTLLGDKGRNIATFHLGRQAPGGDAIALVEIDGDIPDDLLTAVQRLEGVVQARHLVF